MTQSDTPKTPPPGSPTTYSIADGKAVSSENDGLPQSQKPPRIQSPQPLMVTPKEKFTDSGYTSSSTTPRQTKPEVDRANSLLGARPIPLWFFKKKVFLINKPIDQSTRDRFKVIQSSFEKLLLEEIRSHQKPGTRHRPISIRLAMMGTSENDARPHIVIFCQPEQKRVIQTFVKKDVVVDIYRPNNPDTPAFVVTVFANAPKLRLSESNIEVVTDAGNLSTNPQDTLCGTPISFQHPNGQRRNATFGGIIKVVTPGGSVELVGMTAGHVLHQWDYDNSEDMLDARSPQSTPPASPTPLRDDGSFINDGCEVNETSEGEYHEFELNHPFSEFPGALVEDGNGLWDFQELATLGELVEVSKENAICSIGKCYDWALFRPNFYKMNRVPASPKAQLRICDKRPGTIENRSVIVLSSPIGCKVGSILPEPGRILLGGEQFVDTFMVSMGGELGIRDGDSGSWVVDAKRFEVYGQLVASDMFGSGYIIPMTDILSDIKSQLGAQNVELPSFSDIFQAITTAGKGQLVTSVEDDCGYPKYSPRTMSASINPCLSTSTLDQHCGFTILNESYVPYGSLDSGYSSLNPSPNPGYYLSSTRNQSPGSDNAGEAPTPTVRISNLDEDEGRKRKKRKFPGSLFLETRVGKKQTR